MYSALLKEAADKKEEAEQLHSAFEAIVQSIWMGNSQTVRSFLKEMIKDKSVLAGQAPKDFEKKSSRYF